MYIIEQKGTEALGGPAQSWGLGRARCELASGNGEGARSSSGSKSVFRGQRICLPKSGTSSAAPRRSKGRAKLAAGRILKQPGCDFNSAFCSARRTHLCHSPGWQHLPAQHTKGKVAETAAALHSGVGTGGTAADLPCGHE